MSITHVAILYKLETQGKISCFIFNCKKFTQPFPARPSESNDDTECFRNKIQKQYLIPDYEYLNSETHTQTIEQKSHQTDHITFQTLNMMGITEIIAQIDSTKMCCTCNIFTLIIASTQCLCY